jgi:uncharacterized protein
MEASLHSATSPIRHTVWFQTASGRAFDFLDPRPEAVDFRVDVAEPLARLPRFCGHVRSGPYSVAQHCVIGADQLYRETGRADLAAAFLLHDAHEAYIGDIASPVAGALAAYAGACGSAESTLRTLGADTARKAVQWSVEAGLAYLKQSLDAVIYAAADVAYPLTDEARAIVKGMDLRVLATERKHLLARPPQPWKASVENAEPLRIVGRIGVWPWPAAADAWLDRLSQYAPCAQRRRANRAA